MEKTLIISDTLLPISSPPIRKGAVFVCDGEIIEVGKSSDLITKYQSASRVDLGRGILLPGFINAHTHLELGWIRGRIRESDGFIGWLSQIVKAKRDGSVALEQIEASVKEGIHDLLESGVTTVGEISSYGGIDKPLLRRSGLRTVLFQELFDWRADFSEIFNSDEDETFQERPFPHAPYSCSPDYLHRLLKFNSERNTPLGIHLAESPDEVKFLRGEENGFDERIFPLIGRATFSREKSSTPFQYLKKLRFFDETKVTAVHMVQVCGDEVREIIEHDIGIVLCPRSNFFLKVGSPPVKQYSSLQRIGIGTDGVSSNMNLDFLEELRFFYLSFAKDLGGRAPFFTVYLATLGGAKALFLDHKIGSIEAGKQADLIFISAPEICEDPYLSVISSRREDLKLSMVKGRALLSKIQIPGGSL